VFDLGVITGPDMMLLDQIIPDPSSLKQGMKATVLGSVEKRLKEFKNNVNSGAVQQYRAHGFEEDKQKPLPMNSKVESSSVWTDEKAKRLAELRAKKASGTTGK
jgi:hypothetical protein